MDAAVLLSHATLRLPILVAGSKPKLKLGNSILPLKEIADGFSFCASQGDILQQTVSSIRSDGNRGGQPPRKNTGSGRIAKGNGNKIPQQSDGKLSESSNQEDIIALFRRIQSSISKGDSLSTKRRSSNSSEDKASAESVLEVLRQSRKQVKENTPNKEGDKVLTRRRGVPKKEQSIQDSPPVVDLKPTRPPSNFVRGSPIPSPSALSGTVVEQNSERSSGKRSGKESQLLNIEEMKLPALKELAKSRGIKGYSKLKKSELVELLRS